MTYDPTVPGAAQRISDTQAPIQTNFSQANTIFNEDHFTFNDASGAPPPPGLRGFHRKTTLSELAPDPTAYASIGTVYTKDNGSRTDLYYRYDTGTLGNSKVLPLSAIKVMGAFDPTGVAVLGVVPAGQIFQSYNISSITRTTLTTFEIIFSDSLSTDPPDTDMDYIVTLGQGSVSSTGLVHYSSPTKNDRITLVGTFVGALLRISFTIMTL